MRMRFCYSDMTFNFKLKSHAYLHYYYCMLNTHTWKMYVRKSKKKKKSFEQYWINCSECEKVQNVSYISKKKNGFPNHTQRQHQSFQKPDVASKL